MSSMIRRRRRLLWILALVVLGVAVVAGARGIREPIFRAAGWALVVDDPFGPADIVVITIDADGAGVLEAADLIHGGIAPRVAVFADPPDEVDREFLRRGVPYEDRAARSRQQLRSLGVTAIEEIPRAGGTEAEAQVLADWSRERRFRSIVVVCSRDHSRRLRRVFQRSFKGHPTRILVRAARHSTFDPDRWWQDRDGVRTHVVESQKLLLDLIRHPIE